MEPVYSFLKNCRHNWRLLFIIGYPIVLLPIPFLVNNSAGYTAYSISIVAGLWLTEAVPAPVAGLVPIILHPLMEIQSTEQVAQEYMKDAAMVFMGGYLLSLAFEFCGLHKRVALKVMLWSGTSLPKLLLGLMLTTMFLSMWMFNAAAAAMMIPIVLAVLEELRIAGVIKISSHELSKRQKSMTRRFSVVTEVAFEEIIAAENAIGNVPTEVDPENPSPPSKMQNLKTMFLLGICYSANIGGTGVLTGTGPNLIALGYLGSLDPTIHGNHSSLTFTTWMAFATVPMILNILAAWIYLQLIFVGFPEQLKFWKPKDVASSSARDYVLKTMVKRRFEDKYDQLGPLTAHEMAVGIHFLLSATFWALHDPRIITGWSEFFEQKIHISTGTVLTGILLFIIPRNGDFYRIVLTGKFPREKLLPLLEWEYAINGIPWGVFTLLGGGLALSKAAMESGLSTSVVHVLHSLKNLPPYGIQIVCLIFVVTLTEMMSNTAVATLAVPILLELSADLGIHPLYLTFSAAIASSYAFILPVATAPNLIVYTASDMKLSEMARTGVFMSIISLFILCLCSNYYGNILFHFTDYRIIRTNLTTLAVK